MTIKIYKFQGIETKPTDEEGRMIRCKECGRLGHISFEDYAANVDNLICESCYQNQVDADQLSLDV